MIYRIGIEEGKRKKYAYGFNVRNTNYRKVECSECGTWIDNISQQYGVNDYLLISNDYYPDFMYYEIDLVSEKVKDVFEKEKITGCGLEKANILTLYDLTDDEIKEIKSDGVNINKIPIDPPIYYKLHVSIGAECHKKSGLVLDKKCDICNSEYYHISDNVDSLVGLNILKKESLNGNDLFRSTGFGNAIFCTQRFKEIYDKYELTGLYFDEAEAL